MKCPNCHKEIEDQANFCPYCGTKISQNQPPKSNKLNKKNNILLFAIVSICICLLGYNLVSSYFLGSSLSSYTTTTSSSNTIGEIEGSATSVASIYYSVDEFTSAYTNASDYTKVLDSYTGDLKEVLGNPTSTSYIVKVMDNNNVVFEVNNTYTSNDLTINIYRQFDVNSELDEKKYIFKTELYDSFESLKLTEDQLTLMSHYVSYTDLNNLETRLNDREDEFEEKKDNIGHYGLGEYSSNISNIIKKKNDQYYKTIILS